MMTWKEIALDYRQEIEELWKEMEAAYNELDKRMPKTLTHGLKILDKSLAFSRQNVRILSCSEPLDSNLTIPKVLKATKIIEKERQEDENNFKWLRSTKSKRASTVGDG